MQKRKACMRKRKKRMQLPALGKGFPQTGKRMRYNLLIYSVLQTGGGGVKIKTERQPPDRDSLAEMQLL
jgi:hypothetical protein